METETTKPDPSDDMWIIRKDTGESHRVRKIIWSDIDISVWCNTWYGHHVIGVDCEFERPAVSQSDMIALLANVRVTLGALLNNSHFPDIFKQWLVPLHERAVEITNKMLPSRYNNQKENGNRNS